MPIDTAEERKSIVGIHLYFSGPGVTNNASPDQEWRQEAGYSYSGILAGGGGGGGNGNSCVLSPMFIVVAYQALHGRR